VPSRYYAGTFVIDGRRLRLQLARGALPLIQRLARELPYRGDQIRSVTLVHEANRLLVDICAEVAVKLPAKGSVNTVAGTKSTSGGTNVDLSGLTVVHRRVGRNLPGRARRDRRRVSMQLNRRGVAPGPAVVRFGNLITDDPGESLVVAVV